MKTIGGDDDIKGAKEPGKGSHLWVWPKGCAPKKTEVVAETEDTAAIEEKIKALLKPKESKVYRPGTYIHIGYQSDTTFNDWGPWLFIILSLMFCVCYLYIQKVKKEMMRPATPPR